MDLPLTLFAAAAIPAYVYAQWRMARLFSGLWRSLALAPAPVMIGALALGLERPESLSADLPIGVTCFAGLYFLALLAFKSADEPLRHG